MRGVNGAGRRIAYATYCSSVKLADGGLLPAVARYDSARIREVARLAETDGAVLLILSGRYGLLAAASEIPWYDHLLQPGEVAELAAQTAARLRAMGLDEVVWFTADPAADPAVAPYGEAMARGCALAEVPLAERRVPDAWD